MFNSVVSKGINHSLLLPLSVDVCDFSDAIAREKQSVYLLPRLVYDGGKDFVRLKLSEHFVVLMEERFCVILSGILPTGNTRQAVAEFSRSCRVTIQTSGKCSLSAVLHTHTHTHTLQFTQLTVFKQ